MAGRTGRDVTAPGHVTQDMPEKGKAAGAYPLTMVVYAMVPTGGIRTGQGRQDRAVPRLRGQRRPGSRHPAGQLPPGYLPLTAAMRAQTLAAARKVAAQAGNPGTETQRPRRAESVHADRHPAPSPRPAAATGSASATPPTRHLGHRPVRAAGAADHRRAAGPGRLVGAGHRPGRGNRAGLAAPPARRGRRPASRLARPAATRPGRHSHEHREPDGARARAGALAALLPLSAAAGAGTAGSYLAISGSGSSGARWRSTSGRRTCSPTESW